MLYPPMTTIQLTKLHYSIKANKYQVAVLYLYYRPVAKSEFVGGNYMKIEHIAMYVNDIEQVRDFFIRYLDGKSNDGYYNPQTNFRSYFISFDNGARLEIMNRPDLVDKEKSLNRTGFIHIAFSVGSKDRVNELTQLLQNDGYHVVSGPRTTGDGYYESCVVVVEGNQIEITV